MLNKNWGKTILVALYIFIALSIGLRVYVESTNYCSPDSDFYLIVAENVLGGKGLIRPNNYPFSESTGNVYYAVWPAGYAISIAAISFITTLPVLESSKLVNLIFLGLIFILLYKKLGELAWFPALIFCSFGLLEVFSYTWSEGPFLFFILALIFILESDLRKENLHKKSVLPLFFCLIGLFLFRYAGLIYFFLVAFCLLYFIWQKQFKKARQYFIGLFSASLFVLFYLLINYYQTGYLTGGSRIFPEKESLAHFILLLLKGLANQFFLARNYYFNNNFDPLFLILLALQLFVAGMLFKYRKLLAKPLFDRKTNLLILTGVFYLISIIILRKLSPFDKFNYRILAPFSTPIFIALFYSIARQPAFFRKTYIWVVAFMLLSLLANLPKQYLLKLFRNEESKEKTTLLIR